MKNNDIEVVKHNSIPEIGIFARVCYNKESKIFTYNNLINFVSKTLLKHKHMSVFEHIWYHIKFNNNLNEFSNFSISLLNELLRSSELNRYIQLIYFDYENKSISLTARTILELLSENITHQTYITKLLKRILIYDPELIHILFTSEEITKIQDLPLPNESTKQINDKYVEYLNKIEPEQKFKLNTISDLDITDNFIVLGNNNNNIRISLVNKTNIGSKKYDVYTFYIQNVPMYVRDQIIRHRFGVFTVKSLRYTKNINFILTRRSNNLKIHKETCKLCQMSYIELLKQNDKPEIARGILPFHTSTTFFWTLPKISLDNFIQLRTDKHAQYETRLIANTIKKLIGGE